MFTWNKSLRFRDGVTEFKVYRFPSPNPSKKTPCLHKLCGMDDGFRFEFEKPKFAKRNKTRNKHCKLQKKPKDMSFIIQPQMR